MSVPTLDGSSRAFTNARESTSSNLQSIVIYLPDRPSILIFVPFPSTELQSIRWAHMRSSIMDAFRTHCIMPRWKRPFFTPIIGHADIGTVYSLLCSDPDNSSCFPPGISLLPTIILLPPGKRPRFPPRRPPHRRVPAPVKLSRARSRGFIMPSSSGRASL